MRGLAIMLCGMLLVGCASRGKSSQHTQTSPEPERINYWYEANNASALAFAPPVVASAVTPDLSRDGRETAAYVGYESVVTTHFYLRTDDRQIIYGEDAGRYERRAVSERFGVRRR